MVVRSNKHVGRDSKVEVLLLLLLLELIAGHYASLGEIQLLSLLSMMVQAQWALNVGAFADLRLTWESSVEAFSFALYL